MRWGILALTFAALGLAVACGGGSGGGTGGGSSSGGGPEIRATLADFSYTPKEFTLPANTQGKLVLKNTGSVEHDFTIDKVSYKLLVPTAREVSKSIGPLAPGTYDVYCSVPGHKESGMVGTLTVK